MPLWLYYRTVTPCFRAILPILSAFLSLGRVKATGNELLNDIGWLERRKKMSYRQPKSFMWELTPFWRRYNSIMLIYDPDRPDGQYFYRATLCVSVVFAVARCQSVRLSVTLVYCIQMVENIVKLLCRPGSPVILVFWPQRRYPIPIPFREGAKYKKMGKFCDFRLKSPSISETVWDRPMIAVKR